MMCQASGGRGAPSGRPPREHPERRLVFQYVVSALRRTVTTHDSGMLAGPVARTAPPILGLANDVSGLRWAGRPVRAPPARTSRAPSRVSVRGVRLEADRDDARFGDASGSCRPDSPTHPRPCE